MKRLPYNEVDVWLVAVRYEDETDIYKFEEECDARTICEDLSREIPDATWAITNTDDIH